ncbi:hypothetical protein GEMRC1_000812 [Eukaryota sp. GEM-RC1]
MSLTLSDLDSVTDGALSVRSSHCLSHPSQHLLIHQAFQRYRKAYSILQTKHHLSRIFYNRHLLRLFSSAVSHVDHLNSCYITLSSHHRQQTLSLSLSQWQSSYNMHIRYRPSQLVLSSSFRTWKLSWKRKLDIVAKDLYVDVLVTCKLRSSFASWKSACLVQMKTRLLLSQNLKVLRFQQKVAWKRFIKLYSQWISSNCFNYWFSLSKGSKGLTQCRDLISNQHHFSSWVNLARFVNNLKLVEFNFVNDRVISLQSRVFQNWSTRTIKLQHFKYLCNETFSKCLVSLIFTSWHDQSVVSILAKNQLKTHKVLIHSELEVYLQSRQFHRKSLLMTSTIRWKRSTMFKRRIKNIVYLYSFFNSWVSAQKVKTARVLAAQRSVINSRAQSGRRIPKNSRSRKPKTVSLLDEVYKMFPPTANFK